MENSRLYEVLGLQRKWLAGEEGGQRADLRGMDLKGADLSNVRWS